MPSAVGDLPGRLKQRRGIGQIDPELRGEAKLGIFGRHPQPHAQPQVCRSRAILAAGRGDDLVELFVGIEAEHPHPVDPVGLGESRRRS